MSPNINSQLIIFSWLAHSATVLNLWVIGIAGERNLKAIRPEQIKLVQPNERGHFRYLNTGEFPCALALEAAFPPHRYRTLLHLFQESAQAAFL